MDPHAAYPFDRWPRLSRTDARLASTVARMLAPSNLAPLVADARAVLGAEVSISGAGWSIANAAHHAAQVGESIAMVAALGVDRALVSLAPGIARVVADRVVGGSGDDVALGPTPLSRGEAGLVGYVVARVMKHAGTSASLLDVAKTADALTAFGDERVLAWAFTLGIGDHRGQGMLFVPVRAAMAAERAPAAIDPALAVRASIVIGDARLPVHTVRALVVGDVIVPDALSIDPRIASAGRARLVVGRSSRAFEVELERGSWRVVRRTSLAAPKPPVRWRQRKEASMSQPETDTLQSLADLEVELSIELARIDMPVAEVAALAPGVVVTTGRLVGERVAVRAADRVIAWGELVDVDGEVGVRLTEIATHG